jgi:hypothetical protein
MICTEAAEFVSALCDGEIIPPTAAKHIGTCPACQTRLTDYLAMGVELRRTASLEQFAPGAARTLNQNWTRPQNPLSALLQKGWGTMRIPRLAFAALLAGIVALACTLAVVKVGANSTGTVVLLTTTGLNGPLMDCPLSTLDKNQAECDWYGTIGSQNLAYRVRLLSRDEGKVLLAIRTRTYIKGENLSSFTLDADPATKVKEVWFEPGESLKVDAADVGSLTLTGEWMDHMPILMNLHGPDMSPGAGELRFASPLLLKDKKVAGDLAGALSGIFSTDDPNMAVWMYVPGQGSFLVSLLPMKGAVSADVFLSRISFQEGGHSWEFVTGAPVSRTNRIWVLHQPDFKPPTRSGQTIDTVFISTQKLAQTQPGVWEPPF